MPRLQSHCTNYKSPLLTRQSRVEPTSAVQCRSNIACLKILRRPLLHSVTRQPQSLAKAWWTTDRSCVSVLLVGRVGLRLLSFLLVTAVSTTHLAGERKYLHFCALQDCALALLSRIRSSPTRTSPLRWHLSWPLPGSERLMIYKTEEGHVYPISCPPPSPLSCLKLWSPCPKLEESGRNQTPTRSEAPKPSRSEAAHW